MDSDSEREATRHEESHQHRAGAEPAHQHEGRGADRGGPRDAEAARSTSKAGLRREAAAHGRRRGADGKADPMDPDLADAMAMQAEIKLVAVRIKAHGEALAPFVRPAREGVSFDRAAVTAHLDATRQELGLLLHQLQGLPKEQHHVVRKELQYVAGAVASFERPYYSIKLQYDRRHEDKLPGEGVVTFLTTQLLAMVGVEHTPQTLLHIDSLGEPADAIAKSALEHNLTSIEQSLRPVEHARDARSGEHHYERLSGKLWEIERTLRLSPPADVRTLVPRIRQVLALVEAENDREHPFGVSPDTVHSVRTHAQAIRAHLARLPRH